MFAVVDIAGFQEKVSEGDELRVQKLDAETGKTLTFDRVLLLQSKDKILVGSPYVSGARVTAQVKTHGLAEKIRVVKFERRKRYRRVRGHRQLYTDITITKIVGG